MPNSRPTSVRRSLRNPTRLDNDAKLSKLVKSFRISNFAVFFLSAIMCGYGINVAYTNNQWVFYWIAYTGGASAITAFLGMIYPQNYINTFLPIFLVIVFLEITLLVSFAGMSMLLSTNVEEVLAEGEVALTLYDIPGVSALDVKTNLIVMGGLGYVVCGVLTWSAFKSADVVGRPTESLVIILQVMNFVMLPIGLMFIASGFFMADTLAAGSNSTVDVAAAFFVGTGGLLFTITFLGCLSTATASRTLTSVYGCLVFLVMSVMASLGAASLALTSQVETIVSDTWSSIRFALPPNFPGRYDQRQFEVWMAANLPVIGYICVMTGLYCAAMLVASFALYQMFEIDSEDQLLEGVEDTLTREQTLNRQGSFSNLMSTFTRMGSFLDLAAPEATAVDGEKDETYVEKIKRIKRKRIYVKFAGTWFCLSMLLPVVLGITLLMYESYCVDISDFFLALDERTVALSAASVLSISNSYSIGKVVVNLTDDGAAGSAVVGSGSISAANVEYGSAAGLVATVDAVGNVVSFDATPTAPNFFAGRDITCQVAELLVLIHRSQVTDAASVVLDIQAEQSMQLDFPEEVAFFEVDLTSNLGRVGIKKLAVLEGAGKISSAFGAVEIDGLETRCVAGSNKLFKFSTLLGSVALENYVNEDCLLLVDTDSGPILLDKVDNRITTGTGESLLAITSQKGSVSLRSVVSDWIRIEAGSGAVGALFTTANVGMSVVTTVGDVLLGDFIAGSAVSNKKGLYLPPDGVLQIETTGGNVLVHLSVRDGFFGRYFLDTGSSGDIRVINSPLLTEDGDGVVRTTEDVTASGTINCSGGSCNYGGEIIVSSVSGTVTLLVTT